MEEPTITDCLTEVVKNLRSNDKNLNNLLMIFADEYYYNNIESIKNDLEAKLNIKLVSASVAHIDYDLDIDNTKLFGDNFLTLSLD